MGVPLVAMLVIGVAAVMHIVLDRTDTDDRSQRSARTSGPRGYPGSGWIGCGSRPTCPVRCSRRWQGSCWPRTRAVRRSTWATRTCSSRSPSSSSAARRWPEATATSRACGERPSSCSCSPRCSIPSASARGCAKCSRVSSSSSSSSPPVRRAPDLRRPRGRPRARSPRLSLEEPQDRAGWHELGISIGSPCVAPGTTPAAHGAWRDAWHPRARRSPCPHHR